MIKSYYYYSSEVGLVMGGYQIDEKTTPMI